MRSMKVFLSAITVILVTLGLNKSVFASNYLIPVPNRVDMVYDGKRNTLYITGGGSVYRYNLKTDSFLAPLNLGGNLMGIDISPDGDHLLVADSNGVWIHEVDLTTELSKKIFFQQYSLESGTFTVAYGNNGKALITSSFAGSGWVPFRLYDPTSGQAVQLATVRQDTMIAASADRTVAGFAESNSSGGPFGRYNFSDGNILKSGTSRFNYEIGISRDGMQYAIPTSSGTFIYNSTLQHIETISTSEGKPIGVVYSPVDDIVYFAWAGSTKIYAYDTNTFQVLYSFDFLNTFDLTGNHAFVEGRLKMSPDGNILFATVDGGVRYEIVNGNCTDSDGDGYFVGGDYCGPVDCNDNNADIYPGAPELCDRLDNDCNGSVENTCIDITLNKTKFTTGDTIVVTAHITNNNTPDEVNKQIAVQPPKGKKISIENMCDYAIPANADIREMVYTYKFKGSEPAGTYKFGGQFLNSTWHIGQPLSFDIEEFTFTP